MVMVFNATFNNISVISWRSVLLQSFSHPSQFAYNFMVFPNVLQMASSALKAHLHTSCKIVNDSHTFLPWDFPDPHLAATTVHLDLYLSIVPMMPKTSSVLPHSAFIRLEPSRMLSLGVSQE
jgi:hypothetical protein